jgi:hypothetical protein
MRAVNYLVRDEVLAGWPVRITSYQIEGRFYASVENVDAGARISRADAASRDEAERMAMLKAEERLGRSRRTG